MSTLIQTKQTLNQNKTKNVSRIKEGQCRTTKGPIQDYITIRNIDSLNIKIYEAILKEKGEINNNSWRFQYPTFKNGENQQKINKDTEDLNTINPLERRHVQNTPPNNNRMHILLKCKPYILQDK